MNSLFNYLFKESPTLPLSQRTVLCSAFVYAQLGKTKQVPLPDGNPHLSQQSLWLHAPPLRKAAAAAAHRMLYSWGLFWPRELGVLNQRRFSTSLNGALQGKTSGGCNGLQPVDEIAASDRITTSVRRSSKHLCYLHKHTHTHLWVFFLFFPSAPKEEEGAR